MAITTNNANKLQREGQRNNKQAYYCTRIHNPTTLHNDQTKHKTKAQRIERSEAKRVEH